MTTARMLGCACLALAALSLACHRAPQVDQFKRGEDQYLSGDYTSAIASFKSHLQNHPEDSGAHFYLGTCYLYDALKNLNANSRKSMWLGIAQGELETALALFEHNGKANPIPRFNATYFEMMCHINQAKIYLLLMQAMGQNPRLFAGIDVRSVLPGFIEKCVEQAKLAEQVAPGNPDVEQLKLLLSGITSGATKPTTKTAPRPQAPQPPAKPHRKPPPASPLSV